jgi:hypothetical protein
MDCINLRERFPKYQIEYDPAHKRGDDPWMQVIPCHYGHIYPQGGELLAVATNGRKVGLKLAKLPGVTVLQDGDDGMNIAFPITALPKVAAIMKPRRRRKVTEKERERLAGMRNKALLKRTSHAPAASGAA